MLSAANGTLSTTSQPPAISITWERKALALSQDLTHRHPGGTLAHGAVTATADGGAVVGGSRGYETAEEGGSRGPMRSRDSYPEDGTVESWEQRAEARRLTVTKKKRIDEGKRFFLHASNIVEFFHQAPWLE
ncbi:hypothetical protein HPP92_020536 [Vanilla planifolia]|uniref:Uncharacterized protein n=1 Tax=Vanilla planifolia TaxID=51239 RepID=A0A835Q0N4_VANPL|nr:hypothetical protein HPP92_020926 [Vanilla planifolia]KAG0462060.1 hypothetical protein HPP92_020536 [Vanilla planifolia]